MQSLKVEILQMSGYRWSEALIKRLEDKEYRNEYVADQIRTRIALLIRALREQSTRDWSQSRLGQEMGKPQSVISRLEDPDYGKVSLQTLLDVAAAFDLPLWIDIPEWEDWLIKIKDTPNSKTSRRSFNADHLVVNRTDRSGASASSAVIINFHAHRSTSPAYIPTGGSPLDYQTIVDQKQLQEA